MSRQNSGTRALWTVTLACGIRVEMDRVGYETYCVRHNNIVQILEKRPIWYIKCLGCRYARSHGTSLFAAGRAADTHQKSRPDHVMQIWEADKLRQVRPSRILSMREENFWNPGTKTLDMDPPF
jgi:hypothetical protein